MFSRMKATANTRSASRSTLTKVPKRAHEETEQSSEQEELKPASDRLSPGGQERALTLSFHLVTSIASYVDSDHSAICQISQELRPRAFVRMRPPSCLQVMLRLLTLAAFTAAYYLDSGLITNLTLSHSTQLLSPFSDYTIQAILKMCIRTEYRYQNCSHVADPAPTRTNRSAKGQGAHSSGAIDARRSRLRWVNLCQTVREEGTAPCPVDWSDEMSLKGSCPSCALLDEDHLAGAQRKDAKAAQGQDAQLKALLRVPHQTVRVRDGERTRYIVVPV
ncbi:unnamed protein product [Zymoseptoria tritici ST99CH_1A5]|nr:unnamed protein product [Zymoseptoria tritici ST99CH_1A5]